MPAIYRFHCTECDLPLPLGSGSHMYVEDAEGHRHQCVHPLEQVKIQEVLGEDPSQALIQARTGVNSECLCMRCFGQFPLDLDRDVRRCPQCGVTEVRSVSELVGEECPQCQRGVIIEEPLGIA